MRDSSNSKSAYQKIDKLINAQNTINNYLQEERFNTDEILELAQTVELLYEQIETLEQELQHKDKVVEQYQQELMCTISEMSIVNNELQHILSLKKLEVDEAIRVTQNILTSNKSTSESLAELVSTIYGISVTADQLE